MESSQLAAAIPNLSLGIHLIDKPVGWSSFKVVQWMRRQTGEKKVGHAGTLDPFATGLLIVAVGREFTKQIDNYQGMNKVYEAEFVFGQCTTTLDPEGDVTFEDPNFRLDENALLLAMQKWTGEVQQIPPDFSAIHINGRRAYDLARNGEKLTLGPRTVTIRSIEKIDLESTQVNESNTLYLKIHCGKGTYIRSLARDLAIEMGTQGYCRNLRRMAIGQYQVDQAIKISE